jgi:cob(I)alamin adenosyltransferase
MPIYTKKGDKGRTGIFVPKPGKKKRIAKDAVRIEAVGTIDELDSLIGVCAGSCMNMAVGKKQKLTDILYNIQRNLLTTGSIVGGSPLEFDGEEEAKKMEILIDEIDLMIPKLTNFILPGGDPLAAQLHLARSVGRRAERRFVTYSRGKKDVRLKSIRIYLNRLSDFLFTLARYVNYKKKISEEVWKA